MYLVTSKDCAWRAIYLYSGRRPMGVLRFAIGIDPTFKYRRARLFGSIGFRRDCTGGRKARWEWGIILPRSRHWWRLDGRRKWYQQHRKGA